jgi:hypothetical protein
LLLLEPVSKPLEDGEQASDVDDGLEQIVIVSVAHDEAAEVQQPADREPSATDGLASSAAAVAIVSSCARQR